jgi:predicted AlkP superfamily pyrophosphatase or phosphodiesterase
MVTGVLPARHGIYYNSPFEPGGQTGRWYWEFETITARTIWEAVREAGGTTAAVNWPVTVGAPIDYNVPEVWSLVDGFGAVRAVREASTPGLFEELEREATGVLSDADMSPDWIGRQGRSGLAAAYLIETYRPTLTAIHLIAVDHFEHEDGRDSPMVRRALASADTAVGEMIDAARRAGIADRTVFVVTGDHGFFDVHSTLAPNVWLAETGLLEAQQDRGDWRAAFHTAAAAAFLHLRDPEDREAEARVRQRLAELPVSLRRLFRVIERAELDELGADPGAVLALSPVPGISMSSSANGPALRPGSGGTHGFHPDYPELHTGFVAAGEAIAAGRTVEIMGLVDVAPIIAAVLGLDMPEAEGTGYPGLLSRR